MYSQKKINYHHGLMAQHKMNTENGGCVGSHDAFYSSTTAFAYVDESATDQVGEIRRNRQQKDSEKGEAHKPNEVLRKMETRQGTLHLEPGHGESRMNLPMIPQRPFLRLQRR